MKIVRILVLSGVIGVVLLPNILFGQDDKLVDVAKKEGGKVVVYGSIENDTMDLIAGGLKKKTGLKTEYWHAAANKVTEGLRRKDARVSQNFLAVSQARF